MFSVIIVVFATVGCLLVWKSSSMGDELQHVLSLAKILFGE